VLPLAEQLIQFQIGIGQVHFIQQYSRKRLGQFNGWPQYFNDAVAFAGIMYHAGAIGTSSVDGKCKLICCTCDLRSKYSHRCQNQRYGVNNFYHIYCLPIHIPTTSTITANYAAHAN
jgi:hypothetical protein